MGCLLSTSRPGEAHSPHDNVSIVNIKSTDSTSPPTSVPVPPLPHPASNNSDSTNQPETSTSAALQPEMATSSRPPSRMDWEATSSQITPVQAVPVHDWGDHFPSIPPPEPQMLAQIDPRLVQPIEPPTPLPAPMAPPPGPVGEKRCMICTSTIGKSETVYPCSRCKCPYCTDCLRHMFVAATKDESRMPPRCCNMVHLSVARPHLTAEEIALFKAKYEEWNTPNRLYCPIPTCSTFISPRLINAATKAATTAAEQERQKKKSTDNITVVFGTPVKMQVVDPQAPLPPKPQTGPITVACPTCFTEVCASCKEYAHERLPCMPESDQLADMMKKWKIKRCPKCRAAVRKMYGCPHIRCRCGAQWCWFCLGPIDECREIGCPEQEAADREEAGYDTDEDDEEMDEEGGCEDNEEDHERERLERRRRRATEAGDLDAAIDRQEILDLGDEPNVDDLDPWNCEHRWRKHGDSNNNLLRKLECHRCWREVTYEMDVDLNLDRLFEPHRVAAAEKEAAKTTTSKVGNDTAAKPGVECTHCGVIYCNDCRDEVEVENKERWEEFENRVRESRDGH